MNVDWAPGGRQPSDQANRPGLWVHAENWLLPSTSTIAIVAITQPISWYSFYCPTDGGRVESTQALNYWSKGAQPVPKAVYRSSRCDKVVSYIRVHSSTLWVVKKVSPYDQCPNFSHIMSANKINQPEKPSLEVAPTTSVTLFIIWP